MNGNIITDVFENGAEAPIADPIEERELIARAKAGNSDATSALILAYAPALRNGVSWYTRAVNANGEGDGHLEDVRQLAIVGLLEAIRAFDPATHGRLAALAPSYIRHEVAGAADAATAFTVPQRTLTRFFGILRAAEGNVFDAVRLAPEYEMKVETFLAVLSALRDVDSYEQTVDVGSSWRAGATDSKGDSYDAGAYGHDVNASPLWDNSAPDVEDRILVEAALRAVDTLERDVTRLAYGFTEYEPCSDDEVGLKLGLSRQKAQRVRSGALVKMRSALGVA